MRWCTPERRIVGIVSRPLRYAVLTGTGGANMPGNTSIYRVTTVVIVLETFVGGVIDLLWPHASLINGRSVTDVVTTLGFPAFVVPMLGACKVPGAVVIAMPGWLRWKEWAYAGIAFELGGATVANILRGRASDLAASAAFLAIAMLSWYTRPTGRVLGHS